MQSAQDLWQSYHAAVRAGNTELAKRILSSLQDYKSNPPLPRGGCVSCRKRLY